MYYMYHCTLYYTMYYMYHCTLYYTMYYVHVSFMQDTFNRWLFLVTAASCGLVSDKRVYMWLIREHTNSNENTKTIVFVIFQTLVYVVSQVWLKTAHANTTSSSVQSSPIKTQLVTQLNSFVILLQKTEQGNQVPPQKTSQELRMLSSVTINCQITSIVMNSGSQLSGL